MSSTGPYTPEARHQFAQLRELALILNSVGLGLTSLMLVANIFLPDRLKRYPTRLTTLFTLVGALFHANILAGIDMDFLGMLHADAPSTHCKVQAYILQFLAISMLVLWCLICDSLHAILVRQMSPEELDAYERPYLAAWLSVASALTVAPFAIAQPLPQFGAPYCWISHDNMMEWQILFFEVPSLLALLFGVVRGAPILISAYHQSTAEDHTSNDALLDYMVRQLGFLLLFFVSNLGIVSYAAYIVLFLKGVIGDESRTLGYGVFVWHIVAISSIGIQVFLVLGTGVENRALCASGLSGLWRLCGKKSARSLRAHRAASDARDRHNPGRVPTDSLNSLDSDEMPAQPSRTSSAVSSDNDRAGSAHVHNVPYTRMDNSSHDDAKAQSNPTSGKKEEALTRGVLVPLVGSWRKPHNIAPETD